MADRISFSGQHLALQEIFAQHADVEASLRSYFSPASVDYAVRFSDYKKPDDVQDAVKDELEMRLAEHERTTIFAILAALEAAFRIDYLQRSYKKKKDSLSRGFRDLHRKKGSRASLEDEILDEWKKYSSVSGKVIGDLKGAFKYRHWLAHGRYWEPKLGQKYDYYSVYILAESIFGSFPFEGIKRTQRVM